MGLSKDEWVESKLSQMTLEEKAMMLSGVDVWRTYPVKRLGIPQLKTTDGPIGIRGGTMVDGTTAAMAPSAVSMAATFDVDLIAELGHMLAAEVRDKQSDILLAPTVCLHRSPLGGRNFESLSGDDPYLGGKLAAAYINAVQSHGIATTIKHFAANDQETRRFVVDQWMTERCLREMHLVPFQIAIREAQPWCLMASYSKINGVYASNNKKLLTGILRDEWGFDGVVMSDWFGVNSIVPSVEAGMDLEMPGPPRKRGKNLADAVTKGYMEEKSLDVNVRRMLELIYKTGKHKTPDWEEGKEVAIDRPEHREFLRRAAADGIVLLKNDDNLLPLDTRLKTAKSVAFIGPNSNESVAAGGGSASLNPHYRQRPYTQFRLRASTEYPHLKIHHAPGCLTHKFIPLFPPTCVSPITGQHGMYMEWFPNTTHTGPSIHRAHRTSTLLSCYDNLPTASFPPGQRYSYRATGLLTPETTGNHTFSMGSCGPGRMLLDGKEIINMMDRTKDSPRSEMFMAYASPEVRITVPMEEGNTYTIVVEGISRELDPIPVHYTAELYRDEVMDGCRVGFMEEVTRDLMAEAVELARKVDVVVLVVGKNIEWESESYDMQSMDLPGEQDRLISEVLKVNRNVVVVNQSGTPITMPWVEEAKTIIQAWYQGQELGNSLTDILLGHVSPSGKLPVTFPQHLSHTPCFHTFPGEYDRTIYGEGIFLGYRHYDISEIPPLFPFGHGLSYTRFAYSNLTLSSSVFPEPGPEGKGKGEGDGEDYWDGNGDTAFIDVSVSITNTGPRPGKETVQFYISPLRSSVCLTTTPRRPIRELKAFTKLTLLPGETKLATARLDKHSFGYFDEKLACWVVQPGARFGVVAAASSRDLRCCGEVGVRRGMRWLV